MGYSSIATVSDGIDLAVLRDSLSNGALIAETDVLASHSMDSALFCDAGTALALVRAASVEDVQATLQFANERGIPVVPQGARTGLSGAANAVDGAILLSVTRLNRIINVDTGEMTCTVEPGVLNKDLKDHVATFGLAYPPDPGSVEISTIGGNVSTNAGGLCCVKYGVTRDYVRSLTVVLADGRLTTVGRPTAKGAAGLELSQLFIGSEGSLGVIVGITLELIPEIPDPITAVALFPDVVSASVAVSDFMATGIRPSLLELLDKQTLKNLNSYGDFGLPEDAGAMLLAQSNGDGDLATAVRDLETFTKVAESCGADEVMFSDDPADSELLIAARRSVGAAGEKFAISKGGGKLVDDVCVPRRQLSDFFARLVEISRIYEDVVISTSGHAGDGNMHPNVFFDIGDSGSVARAQVVFDDIMAAGLQLGGTITGEHGVGFLKRDWLARELDPVSRDLHIRIKQALDPNGILNPGKMFAAL